MIRKHDPDLLVQTSPPSGFPKEDRQCTDLPAIITRPDDCATSESTTYQETAATKPSLTPENGAAEGSTDMLVVGEASELGAPRAFNHIIAHEIKNHIGIVLGAIGALRELPDLTDQKREKFLSMIATSVRFMEGVVKNVLDVARLDHDASQHRRARFPEAAAQACQQLRDAARAVSVRVTIAGSLPDIEVNAYAVGICLTNLLSNAIKYADPGKADRFAEIHGILEPGPAGAGELVVRVRDNGLGVPPAHRARIFERFYRAHDTVIGVEGTGLGLAIVRETAESLGGRAWAEFHDEGTVFAFSLPHRRGGSVSPSE